LVWGGVGGFPEFPPPPPIPPLLLVPPLLHPKEEKIDANTRSARIAGIAARLSLAPKGRKKIAAVRSEPRPMAHKRALVWLAAVLMVTVKGAALPPVTASVDGVKVQEAFVGRLLQFSARVPEYPFAGRAARAYVADLPAGTVLPVLPPVCATIVKGVWVPVPEMVRG
jgi:hypothetical protein